MFFGGWWDMADIDKYAPNLKYGITPLPKYKKRGTHIFTTATVMNGKAKHPKETWEFIKFMTGKEGQIVRCKLNMAGPSRKSVAAAPEFAGWTRERIFIDGFEYGKTFYGEYIGIADDEFGQAIARVMLGQDKLEPALKKAIANYYKRIEQNP